jgi:hypothetical protein
MDPMPQLLVNMAPWVRLQRTSTLAELCRMLGAELQRREIPSSKLLFDVALDLEHRGEPERVAR